MCMLALGLKEISLEELIFIVEKDEKPAGISLNIPDINDVISEMDGHAAYIPSTRYQYGYHKSNIQAWKNRPDLAGVWVKHLEIFQLISKRKAKNDLEKLDGSIKKQILKKLIFLETDPFPGKPPGNRAGMDLTDGISLKIYCVSLDGTCLHHHF